MPRRFQFRLSTLFLVTLLVGIAIASWREFGAGVLLFSAGALSAWAGARLDISRGRTTLAHGAYAGTILGALGVFAAAALVRYWQPVLDVAGPNYYLRHHEILDAATNGAALGLLITVFVTAKRLSLAEAATERSSVEPLIDSIES